MHSLFFRLFCLCLLLLASGLGVCGCPPDSPEGKTGREGEGEILDVRGEEAEPLFLAEVLERAAGPESEAVEGENGGECPMEGEGECPPGEGASGSASSAYPASAYKGAALEDLEALYMFNEGGGNVVFDVSGVEPVLDLAVANPSNIVWGADSLEIVAGTTLATSGPADKLITSVQSSGEITVEAWLRPANVRQTGPARVVSISGSTRERNFTLGQAASGYDARLRTTATSTNGIPSLTTFPGVAGTVLQHIVYTRSAAGDARVYADGVLAVDGLIGGAPSNWDPGYPLLLGNEAGGTRPWLGTYHLVALYSRALTEPEVYENFLAGPAGNGTGLEPRIEEFSAAPSSLFEGQSAILSWSTRFADGASIDQGVGPVALNGSIAVAPLLTTAYTLTATGPDTSATASVTVTVTPPLAPVIDYFTAARVPLANPIRIMPLGDSITQSFSDLPSFRRRLWQLTQADGFSVDFVGTLSEQAGGPNPHGDFDLDHEGHGGYRTDTILAGIDTWAGSRQPDIVLIHLGTNDANQDVAPETSIDNLGQIIDVLRARNPQVAILLARIIGAADGRIAAVSGLPLDQEIDALNALIPGLVATKNTPASPVVLVDHNTGFDANALTFDGVHPTEAGENLMADTWYGSLRPFLAEASGDDYTLNWETSYATEASIAPEPGGVSVDGSVVVTPTETTTYVLAATGPGGATTASVTIAVDEPPPLIDYFTATPGSILEGDTATLAWGTTNGASAFISPVLGNVSLTGSTSIGPASSTTYTLTVLGGGGVTSATVAVTVQPAPRPPVIVQQPLDVYVREGQSAAFSVQAEGAAPLGYQWQRNGADIPDAFASSYTSPPTTLSDDGAAFRCAVSNSLGSAVSESAILHVREAGARVVDGLLVLYAFEEGGGDVVYDVSGVGSPLDLLINDSSAAAWGTGALEFSGGALAASEGPATKVIDAVRTTEAVTLELWATPANLSQTGPARMCSISASTSTRNVTLGQWETRYDARLRTTETSNNGIPSLTTPYNTATVALQHIVYTRDPLGNAVVYVDSTETARSIIEGSTDNWDANYRLGLGNELNGARPWAGAMHLAAVYGRALTAEEVAQNFVAGPDGDGGFGDVAIDLFSVTPDSILLGEEASLTWQTNGATSVSIAPEPGAVQPQGTAAVVPAESTVYVLTASGPGGVLTASVSLDVAVPPPPSILFFTATPELIEVGESTVLAWDSENATSASIDGGVGPVPVQGSYVAAPTTNTVYTLTVSGPGDTATASVLVTVNAPPSPPIIVTPPLDQSVRVGDVAIFSVTADGTAPLAYQWQRNGADIAGAAAAAYTTAPVALANDGETYRCVVSNSAGSATSEEAILTVRDSSGRIEEGLIAFYEFEEGSGTAVHDTAANGAPLDLTLANPAAATWITGGLSVNSPTLIASAGPASKITDAVTASNAVTLEAWLRPANLSQRGPARAVTISLNTGARNITLGQQETGWETRLRTTETSGNGFPRLALPPGTAVASLQHVVYTHDALGQTLMYVDGVEMGGTTISGTLANWDPGYRLGLANELNQARPWLGEVHLVAFYDRALSSAEVVQNFDAGSG